MLETRAAMKEETLDPDDWNSLRALGHRMVDEMLDYLRTVRERPVWQPIPSETKEYLKQPVPLQAQGAEEAYDDFRQHVLPHPMGNIHPRFWGWVIGTGTPTGALAEMLAATMNPNVGGCDQGAIYVELQVLDWCKEMFGYPLESSGLLVSGGSMANLVGLTVARNAKAGFDVGREGVHAAPRKLVMYGSSEMHSSLQKAAELLGLGSDGLRKIPVNAEFQIDVGALTTAIKEDRERGFQPCCVIGNAGTVNTGAIDDLNELADLCAAENLWFHVDGAFGALVALSPELRSLLRGMERADSLAFDLHKWMYMPYEAGCILVRNADEHHRSFNTAATYLAHARRGLAAGQMWFNEYGVQLSRSFKALKIWMLLKEHGLEKYGRLIRQNVEQARYLKTLIEAQPELELLAPVPLNIVCFRYINKHLGEDQLNELNEELLAQLQERGIAVPSSTILDGKYAIRVAITNHRSRRDDFDLLIEKTLELARQQVENYKRQTVSAVVDENKLRIELRMAVAADAPSIAAVLTEAFVEYKHLYTDEGYAATTPAGEQILNRMSEGPVWVALQDESLIGTIAVVPQGETLYIRGMAVLPATRGVGVGKLLLEQVANFAIKQGYGRLLLSTTPFLKLAIHLYEHAGFSRSGEGPHDLYGTPLFSMEKILTTRSEN